MPPSQSAASDGPASQRAGRAAWEQHRNALRARSICGYHVSSPVIGTPHRVGRSVTAQGYSEIICLRKQLFEILVTTSDS